jgi:biotin carboxyl carrier protein
LLLDDEGAVSPWDLHDGFRLNSIPRRAVLLAADGAAELVDLDAPISDEAPFPLVTDLSPRRFAVTTGGDTFLVTIPEFSADADAALGGNVVKAPMPGKVLSVLATAGMAVTRGETLAVLEAMKMEHALAAPRDGVVETVHASAGQQVADGDVLVMLVEE